MLMMMMTIVTPAAAAVQPAVSIFHAKYIRIFLHDLYFQVIWFSGGVVGKIAEWTLNKCLQEFKNTLSGDLSVHGCRNMWPEQESDLAFTRRKEKWNHVDIENEAEADVPS